MTTLWDPVTIGNLTLPHRFAMAPMTRSRAKVDRTPATLPCDITRSASFRRLIMEGTKPSDDGQGYLTTPGIYTEAICRASAKMFSGATRSSFSSRSRSGTASAPSRWHDFLRRAVSTNFSLAAIKGSRTIDSRLARRVS
jgi:NADH:flavin oxidoreductase / NADH oxidase family